ncbi:MAG: NACHT domain-containing protein [Caldilinea sp. CFX5]|nr:NACHT domain-containing protein [Caldilinea sp. CFX5]
MSDSPQPPTQPPTTIGGNVNLRDGHFIGRDYNHLEVHFSGAELESLFGQLLPLLRSVDGRVADGVVSAQGQSLTVTAAQAEALGQYLLTNRQRDHSERELHYLARLCIDPTYQQWQRRYTPLAGGYRPAPQLDPRFSEILVRGDGPQRQIERIHLPDIRDALDRHAAAVLLAQPGAGKTTVLQRLLLDLALQRLQSQPPSAAAKPARLPFFVRLAAQLPDETPLAFLTRAWQAALPGAHSDAAVELTQALQRGELCLLCDALNEARRDRYAERMADWRDFARDLPAGNRLLFTCRSQDYYGELAVQQVEIDPLAPEQIADFCRRYLDEARGAQLWQTLQSDHAALLPLAAIPYYLLMIVEVYGADGALPTQRARLFEQFALRLLQREAERRHADWIEPAAQHWLLGDLAFAMQALGEGTEVSRDWVVNTLPTTVTLPKGPPIPTPAATLLRLGCAATLLSETPSGGFKFAHHLLQEYFAAEALLRRHQQGADLSGNWRVPSSVRAMPPAERGQWDPLPGPPTSGWEQTTILAAGLYPALIDSVLPVNPALAARCLLALGTPPPSLPQIGGGAVVPPTSLRRPPQTGEGGGGAANSPGGSRLPPQTGEGGGGVGLSTQQALLARLGNVAIHLRSRIEAGLLLGKVGDPRFPLETINGVQVILPPMVNLPAATATIGSGWWDRQANSDEKPRHTVNLAAYALGRYPVTNAEYACFMAAGGYEEERYWTAGGQYWLRGEPVPGEEDPVDWWVRTWQRLKEKPTEINDRVKKAWFTERDAEVWRDLITWPEEEAVAAFRNIYPTGQKYREPRYWHDDAFNNPSQPVVGVCWYEAMAYAAWLATLTGNPYRLPSEAEWEWGARRGRRLYPWGSFWDATKCNSLEERVMRTTPVGAYPHGATPDGLFDLSGNVWEWTVSLNSAYPYQPNRERDNADATGLRINRGGARDSSQQMVRGACRGRSGPRDRSIIVGYRLARLPPS